MDNVNTKSIVGGGLYPRTKLSGRQAPVWN